MNATTIANVTATAPHQWVHADTDQDCPGNGTCPGILHYWAGGRPGPIVRD